MSAAGALCQHFGIEVASLPPVAGTRAGTVVIAGSGRTLWSDLEAIGRDFDTMAVNDAIMHFPYRLAHAYSNAAERLPLWVGARREDLQARDNVIEQHHCRDFWRGGNFWPWPGHGTSGLNAVYTAMGLGYERIIVVGMPLDNTGHYFDPPWRGNPDYKAERRYWLGVKEYLTGTVFGISGWIAETFGHA